jgi:hypothetical protein
MVSNAEVVAPNLYTHHVEVADGMHFILPNMMDKGQAATPKQASVHHYK